MDMLKNKKSVVIFLVLVLFAVIALNIEVSIRSGVDGCYAEIKMPLFVKWIQFLARHYEYARIAKEITGTGKADEEKVLAILSWTHENIKDTPKDMPMHDDHILNIIIRGYGVPEQFQDVFTTLCAYSGIPAFWRRMYDPEHKSKYALSFVKLNGKWRVFDAHYGKYFRNKSGEIASADDIIADRSLVDKESGNIVVNGIAYEAFYLNLSSPSRPRWLRAEKQMPAKRVFFELEKLTGRAKEDPAEEGHGI
ncbi:MAG: transglutaminase domain-containing protein [Candidatus Omnitrophota bacterium]|nr:transglutaminase domain-containing protein [Candidatus Omnitrophota bacterium]